MPRSLQEWLSRWDELGARGRYFEAHEELEEGWKAASGAEKVLLQGAIQVAAGLHRLRLHPEKPDGALYLLERGTAKLRKTRALLDPAALEDALKRIDEIAAGRAAPPALRLGLKACG